MRPAENHICICRQLGAVSEAAALAAETWVGRGDGNEAEFTAGRAMQAALDDLPWTGRVVGGRRGDGAFPLPTGTLTGAAAATGLPGVAWEDWQEQVEWDWLVKPLQGREALADGREGAVAAIAAGPPGSLPAVPEMYLEKIVVPAEARGLVDIDRPLADNLRAVAVGLGRPVEQITVGILDRARHKDLVAAVRECGARVHLFADGDLAGSLAVAMGGGSVDLAVGIGGATAGIMTAVAMRALDGEVQARLWPVSRRQVEEIRALG
ncbi:MAG: fructose-bisphosphatase class II, partial [Thermoleophilia bacterium]|nr:fructose-bisphosphatase class II [Thermoleophilia bacterium]